MQQCMVAYSVTAAAAHGSAVQLFTDLVSVVPTQTLCCSSLCRSSSADCTNTASKVAQDLRDALRQQQQCIIGSITHLRIATNHHIINFGSWSGSVTYLNAFVELR